MSDLVLECCGSNLQADSLIALNQNFLLHRLGRHGSELECMYNQALIHKDIKLSIKAGRNLSDHLVQLSHFMITKGQGQGSDLLKATEQVCDRDRVGWSVPSPKLALFSCYLLLCDPQKENLLCKYRGKRGQP